MATKKATVKKTTKKAPAKRATARKTTTKKVAPKKNCSNAYFWGGIAIALCAAGAFMVLAFGIGSVIR
jgi:hypothetical protein